MNELWIIFSHSLSILNSTEVSLYRGKNIVKNSADETKTVQKILFCVLNKQTILYHFAYESDYSI